MSSEARIVRKTVEDYVYRTPPHLRDCAVLADHIVEALQASPPIPDRSPEDSTMPIRACLQWCVDHDGECLGDHQAILASAIEALNNGPSAGEPRNSVPEAREEAHQLRKELANYLPDLNGKFHLPENIVMRIKAALLSAPSSIGENGLLRQLVLDCQNDLATYIVPDSGISEHDVVNTLLGRLDGPQSRAALSTPSATERNTIIEECALILSDMVATGHTEIGLIKRCKKAIRDLKNPADGGDKTK